jgi:glycine betaine/proline transport system substrate-binding protein
MMRTLRRLCVFIAGALVFSASHTSQAGADEKPVIQIGYVEGWVDSVAKSNVAAKIISEKLGFQTRLVPVEAGLMWQGVARGDLDVTFSAWLPVTHAAYLERFKSQTVDLGPNLTGARIGLVVPDYVDVRSISDLAGKENLFDDRIVGIDSGAGVVLRTSQAITAYQLKGYRLVPSSGAGMTAELARAVNARKPIVVTGWSPDWMFAKYKLRFLDDPQKVFGEAEPVDTIVSLGLEKKAPAVVRFFRQFRWNPGEIDGLLLAVSQGQKADAAAEAWLATHQPRVNEWAR